MIVTVSLNPALHVNYAAERIAWGSPNQVSRVRFRAGGRGLAVARVLHTFGHEVVAAGLAGGAAGEMIRTDLAAAGVATQFTRIAMESRRVLEVADASAGQVTTFSEPAPYITTEELGRLAADYRSLMDGATAVVLCGSLPAGLPPEIYGTFATYAADAKVPAILDAGGMALMHGLSRRPALVIPEIAAGPALDPAAAVAAGPAVDPAAAVAAGAGAVVLLSGREVRVVTPGGQWRARLPGAVSLGASRDALVAGFVPGVALGWSWPDTLMHAVAIAAAGGPDGEVDLRRYEDLLTEVRVDQPPAHPARGLLR